MCARLLSSSSCLLGAAPQLALLLPTKCPGGTGGEDLHTRLLPAPTSSLVIPTLPWKEKGRTQGLPWPGPDSARQGEGGEETVEGKVGERGRLGEFGRPGWQAPWLQTALPSGLQRQEEQESGDQTLPGLKEGWRIFYFPLACY